MAAVLIMLLLSLLSQVRGGVVDSQGPLFLAEPRALVEFANETGALLECSASGSPLPRLDWVTSDGSSVTAIPHIREVLANGSLYFPPFGAESYRHDVHSTVYRCEASNSVGRIVSRDVNVRAVVAQHYEVQVRDSFVLAGNTAMLVCEIPAFVKDQVSVTSWVQDGAFNIYPSPESDGKFHMVPTGELLVYSVTTSDSHATYRCRTVHRITGKTIESSTHGRVVVTEHRGLVPPRYSDRVSPVAPPVREGDFAVLLCVSQGFPPPEFWWERPNTGLLLSADRYHVRGGVLVINNVRLEDAGLYTCHTNNTAGRDHVELDLSVLSSLHAHILPHQMTIDLGRPAELLCSVSGQPLPAISWAKDGVTLREAGSYRIRINGPRLHLTSVTREDKGMYQCFAKNEYEMVQATAELRLGDAAPQLMYKFIEQTMQPGPSVSLKCIAAGNPTPHFSWTLDGFPLPHNDRLMIGQYVTVHGDVISHVNISVVRVADGGEYKCEANNRVGSVYHAARLNIYGLPLVRPMSTIAAVAGRDLTIKCPVAGFPIAAITWEKDGQLLPVSRRQTVTADGTLIVHGVDKASDSGSYTCAARNKQNHRDAQIVHIDVKVPPKIEPFSFPANIHAGARVHVTCVVSEGDSPLKIEWFKDGATLAGGSDTPLTYQIGDFDLALRIVSATPQHNGNYTCVARNEAATSSHTALLLVHVPPRVAPFSFNKDLSEGVRAQVTCVIEKGDPPFTIAWYKDSDLIPGSGAWGLKIIGIDAHSSTIVVENLSARHTGNFTCLAKNMVAEVRHTAELVVSVPPHWAVEPQDQQAAEGLQRLAIHCQAEGFPIPTVTWRRAQGGVPGNYRDLEPSLGTKVHSNGSLLIHNLQESHEGYYLCEAVNGIGAGLGKVIHLTVNAPARFFVKQRNETARLGSPASIKCEVRGDKPLKLVWRKAGSILDLSSSHYRYTVKEVNLTDGLASELSIASTLREDGGRYYCMANNAFGRDETSIQFYIQEPPDLPRNVHVIDKGSRFVKLGWILSQDGNSPITQYSIEYKTEKDVWHEHTARLSVPGTQATARIEGLRPATSYRFRLFAENQIGRSQPSDVLDVITDGEKPGGAPVNVHVDATSSTELRVTWDPPDPDLCNGEILGYHIGYKEHRQHPEKFQYKSVGVRGEFMIGELREFTPYSVVVQAYNSLGPGPTSDEATVSTLESVPSAPPRDVKCTSLSSQSLQISWESPPDNRLHGLLQGYKVLWDSLDQLDSATKSETKVTSSVSAMIHGLERHGNYSVQVLAYTRAGDGVLSAPITCTTDEDVPEAPAALKAVASSPTSITVSWLQPFRSNGVITAYTLQIRSVGGGDGKSYKRGVAPHLTKFDAEGLARKSRYEFSVSASTRIGEGPYTAPVQVSPSSEVRAAIVSFGLHFTVPWKREVKLPCLHVGRPEVNISWKQWGQMLNPSARTSFGQDGGLHITDLRREDGGNYSCHVENRYGSDKITHRLTIQVPPSAPLLHATASTPSSLTLQWKQGDDGGAPVRGYILHYRRVVGNGDWEEVSLGRHSSGYVLADLRCGTAYHLYVTARNAIGMGAPSEVVLTTTEGSKPSFAPNEGFLEVNTTWVDIRLDKWVDGGCPILYFEIEYRRNENERWTLVSNSVQQQRSFPLKSLQPGMDYQLRIRGHNVAGTAAQEYHFHTLALVKSRENHGGSGTLSPSLTHSSHGNDVPPLMDPKFILPIIALLLSIVVGAFAVFWCLKKKPVEAEGEEGGVAEDSHTAALENKQNLEQREQYYATVRKPLRSPVREIAALERIPGTREVISPTEHGQCLRKKPDTSKYHNSQKYSEDIYPYATFQLNQAVAVETRCTSGAPRLQTFVYPDTDTLQIQESDELYRGLTKSSLGSDYSRCAETSNQVDHRHNIVREPVLPVPELERKSFPRRKRSKMLQLARYSIETGSPGQHRTPSFYFPSKLDPPTGFSDTIELSEAECDLDARRRLRDFTIAV